MAGTKAGGRRAARTNQAKYDEEYLSKYGMTFYQYVGSLGGKKGKTGGFYANRALASRAGKIGGAISRRGPHKLTESHIAALKKVYGRNERPKT